MEPDDNITSGTDLLGELPSVKSVDKDPILEDISAIFGEGPGDEVSSGRKKAIDGLSSVGDIAFTANNAPSNPEELLRRLQSERDKATAQVKKYEAEVNQYKPIADFIASLDQDQSLKEAFIAELAPDLVKPKDPLTFIQERLKKEFGEEFTPDKHEADLFGSQTWLYNERAKELLQEYRTANNKVPKSLKDLRAERKLQREEAQRQAVLEKQEIMNKRAWDEDKWSRFTKWIGGVKGMHMAAIWEGLESRKGGTSPSSLAGQPGGRPLVPSQLKANLDKMFGPN
jgi:hypothetical protein